jgi:hypothetical protein
MVIETMMIHGNLIQSSIEEALNPSTILCKAIDRGSIYGKAINQVILRQGNKARSYFCRAINRGPIVVKAINLEFNHGVRSIYWSLPNNRLELTAALRST